MCGVTNSLFWVFEDLLSAVVCKSFATLQIPHVNFWSEQCLQQTDTDLILSSTINALMLYTCGPCRSFLSVGWWMFCLFLSSFLGSRGCGSVYICAKMLPNVFLCLSLGQLFRRYRYWVKTLTISLLSLMETSFSIVTILCLLQWWRPGEKWAPLYDTVTSSTLCRYHWMQAERSHK